MSTSQFCCRRQHCTSLETQLAALAPYKSTAKIHLSYGANNRYQHYKQQETTSFSAVPGNTGAKHGDRATKKRSKMRRKKQFYKAL